MNESKEGWQALSVGQTKIVRFRIDPGFVQIQVIEIDPPKVSTISLANNLWFELIRLSRVKPKAAPWIQNPEKGVL